MSQEILNQVDNDLGVINEECPSIDLELTKRLKMYFLKYMGKNE